MHKYVLKFRKEGYIKYTSHLDLIRLFHRAFKMSGLKLDYSIGFNPHPKMSFIQPLSLGYSSRAELLEFELKDNFEYDLIIKSLNQVLPEGISVREVQAIDLKKPLAGLVESCEYNIYFPINLIDNNFELLITSFFNQDEIIVSKRTKKGDFKDINIKPMIRNYKYYNLGEFAVINTLLDSGSNSNLSPELLINSILEFNEYIHRSDLEVERIAINFSNNFHF